MALTLALAPQQAAGKDEGVHRLYWATTPFISPTAGLFLQVNGNLGGRMALMLECVPESAFVSRTVSVSQNVPPRSTTSFSLPDALLGGMGPWTRRTIRTEGKRVTECCTESKHQHIEGIY